MPMSRFNRFFGDRNNDQQNSFDTISTQAGNLMSGLNLGLRPENTRTAGQVNLGNYGAPSSVLNNSLGSGNDRYQPTRFENAFGYTDNNGIRHTGMALPMLQVGQGAFNAFMGMRQYGLAKDQFKQNRREFDLNFGAQRNMINSQLEDRQRARIASNPNAYQSVSEYMKKYGVK